jgi:hypothetical protein
VFFCSCTDALVQPFSAGVLNADDRLTLRGRVCSPPADPSGFPVKVVFIVDQSGSMCVSDPPGSQEGNGFCDRADIQAIIPPGVTQPARVRALTQLVQQLAGQPNVTVSVVPFETNVKNTWPPTSSGQRFARPNADLYAYIRNLQNQLGKGTDYQGVLSYVYSLISSDIGAVATLDPARLPRTRYVVVFLTPCCFSTSPPFGRAAPSVKIYTVHTMAWRPRTSPRRRTELPNGFSSSSPSEAMGSFRSSLTEISRVSVWEHWTTRPCCLAM